MNNLTIAPSDLDRRAQAIADVHQTHEDLRKALSIISELQAEVSRQKDRVAMLMHTNQRLDREMHVFRDKCMELATVVSNIGLQTVSAQNIVMTVRELTEANAEELIRAER